MFEKIKGDIYNNILSPPLIKRGWRPPTGVKLDQLAPSGNFGYDEEVQIKKAIAQIMGHSMTTFERLATLWQQVKYLDQYNLEGDFVECGVWKGGAPGIMALAHQSTHKVPKRVIHLFDSFEGLPEPDSQKDGVSATLYAKHLASGKMQSIQECVGTLQDNKNLLEVKLKYPSQLLKYHIGWFQKTVPVVAPQIDKIAVLRLDGDWYESTKICLDNLYSKVIPGGVVIIDDYGHWEGCRLAVDEFIKNLNEPILLNHIDYSCRYWIRALPKST
ncbi:MAG: TylF/MycF/NovP-related O-methyltransferase [Oligoflexia bacterium]|nr:TylF/MycF/NovP-related O-methyltransferase [Oligoflexia bacterium]